MFRRLTLLWRRFAPLEERLIAAVGHALAPEVQAIFAAQVTAINRVQRSPPAWSEIRFYRLRRGRPDWSGVPMFPRVDEHPLAEVRFEAAGRRFVSRLASIQGHIFDFQTRPGPRAVAFTGWQRAPEVALLADPMHASVGTRAPAGLPPLPPGWSAMAERYRDRSPAGWVVYDSGAAYRVTLEEGEYLVLAERQGDEFVLLRIDAREPTLLYLPHHDGVPEPLRERVETLFEAPRFGV